MSASRAAARALPVVSSLTLPRLDGQSQEQVRGMACVWCRTPLTDETAINLGKRRHRRLDGHYHTYPRSCRACTHRAANCGLQAHVAECEQCVDDVGQCETGMAWTRLMRETR